MFEIGCIVDIGTVREQNDDRASICGNYIEEGKHAFKAESVTAMVFDGVGGEAFGGEAAEIAALQMNGLTPDNCNEAMIMDYVKRANDAILEKQKADALHARMATTVAGICLQNDDFMSFNVGDSKIYRIRGPFVMKLSEDHTLSNELRTLGLEPSEAQQHTITRFLGGTRYTPEIMDGRERSFEQDLFVLCTDGVSDVIEDEELASMIDRNRTPLENCQAIIDCAIDRESSDNLSIVIIRRI